MTTASPPPPCPPPLPRGVLTGYVFPFLGAKSLCRCAQVSREWREAADEDHLWKALCVRKWQGKVNVPRVVSVSPDARGPAEPASLFAEARFGRNTGLSVKDMKEILSLRKVDFAHKLEKRELMDAILNSQGASFGTYAFLLSSKWKTSYVYSSHVVLEMSVSREELVHSEWSMEFKQGMGPPGAGLHVMQGKFHPDGRYSSSLMNVDLTWRFLDDDHSRNLYQPEHLRERPLPPNRHALVQIGEYPPLYVNRRADMSLELHNGYVMFWQT